MQRGNRNAKQRHSMPVSVAAWAILLVSVIFVQTTNAYFEQVDTSSRALSFGNAYAALATDVSAVAWNPGGLGALTGYELQTSYSRPYFVPDLLSSAVLFGGPALSGGLGLGWHRLGNEFLSENLFFLSYGRWVYRDDNGVLNLGGALKVGHVGVDAASDQPDYKSETVLTGDLGALYQSRFGVSVGAVLRNVGEPNIEFVDGGAGTVMETEFDLAAAYRWRPESTVSAGWTSAGRSRDAFRVGGEIWFYDVFAVRLGVQGTEFAGGFGLKAQRWTIDSSFVTHAQLGLSGRVTLIIPFSGVP